MNVEQDIIRLIHREARLLDDWSLDEWLALYTDDALYWIPMDEKGDPRTGSSIVYDQRRSMGARVEQAMRERRPSQQPRSNTVRMLTNIEVSEGASADIASARCAFMCWELRAGDWRQDGMGDKQVFVGHVHYGLRREAEGWRFTEKRIVLIDRHQPIEGLSFIL